eukprot:scaffold91253_cov51-Phaeocystis_antarctica.AAC.1
MAAWGSWISKPATHSFVVDPLAIEATATSPSAPTSHALGMSLQQLLRRNIAASVLHDAAGDGGQRGEGSGRDSVEARLQDGGGGGGGG